MNGLEEPLKRKLTAYELVNGFIDHLYTPLGVTSNYRATAYLHISHTTAISLLQSAVFSATATDFNTLNILNVLQHT
jgi:hypothetical protein